MPLSIGNFCAPSRCDICLELVRRARAYDHQAGVTVQSWCRACGYPALIKVPRPYGTAVRVFERLHETKMCHDEGDHVEDGGWGAAWRLDEVLAKVFPREYSRDPRAPYWSTYPWQELDLGAGNPIIVMPRLVASPPMSRAQIRRAQIEEGLNKQPRGRAELARDNGDVWDDADLRRHFEMNGLVSPFALVTRRADGVRGSVVYQDKPRFYWSFSMDRIV